MVHYVRCRGLFKLVCFLNNADLQHPIQIYNILGTSLDQLKLLCCVYAGYHAIHRFAQGKFSANLENLALAVLPEFWEAFAEAFVCDARELGVYTRPRFSAPEFISFLSSSLLGGDGIPGDGIPLATIT